MANFDEVVLEEIFFDSDSDEEFLGFTEADIEQHRAYKAERGLNRVTRESLMRTMVTVQFEISIRIRISIRIAVLSMFQMICLISL
jgi:hypothetical protein